MGMGCVPGLGKWEYLASKIIKGCSQVSFIAGGIFFVEGKSFHQRDAQLYTINFNKPCDIRKAQIKGPWDPVARTGTPVKPLPIMGKGVPSTKKSAMKTHSGFTGTTSESRGRIGRQRRWTMQGLLKIQAPKVA